MHKDPASPGPGPGEPPLKTDAMTGEALARRRALIKGLGKGSAVVAAVVPIQSFAVPAIQITHANTLCTLSGQMSNVLSRALTSTVFCEGYPPAHYFIPSINKELPIDWPALDASVSKFRDVFGGSDNTKLITYLIAGGNQAYWIAAYFNAKHVELLSKSFAFPYSSAEVIAQFNGPDAAAYLLFYKTHLSSLA